MGTSPPLLRGGSLACSIGKLVLDGWASRFFSSDSIPSYLMTQSAPTSAKGNLVKLREQLGSRFIKTRKAALQKLVDQGEPGLEILQGVMLEEQQGEVSWLSGSIYRILRQGESTLDQAAAEAFLAKHFPRGVVQPCSDLGVDYDKIQQLLIAQDYKEADRQSNLKLCELAGPLAMNRRWLYFSDVPQIPVPDLKTLDQLWRVYSEDSFGYSIQREIWLGVGQSWDELWPKIGWKSGNVWTRYPGSFTWDLSAPRGHLPLSNQLRGVRVMDALMNHPAFAAVPSQTQRKRVV